MFLAFFKNIFCFNESATAKIGRKGEKAACARLKSLGLKIIARNYKSGRNEIDIVAADGDCLVFVEVKTRAANALAGGYFAAVSKRKRAAVRACAKNYMAAMRRKPANRRFDVVEVEHEGGRITEIRHLENVPY